MRWEPIKTAPVGQTILAWADYMDEPKLGYVCSNDRITEPYNERDSALTSVTHWMPLPAGPAEGAGMSAAQPITPSQPSGARAVRAFEQVRAMEADLNRVNGVLRLFIMMDMEQVFSDASDASAVLELIYGAEEAMARIEEKRGAAFHELHPFKYPASPRGAAA